MHTASTEFPTVRVLVERFASPTAEVVADENSLEREAVAVTTVATLDRIGAAPVSSVVVIPREIASGSDVALDLALRRAAAAHVSCVVVEQGDSALPLPTRELAATLGLAVWREPNLRPDQFREAVETAVGNPLSFGMTLLGKIVDACRVVSDGAGAGEVVARIGAESGLAMSLITSDGSTLSGKRYAWPVGLAETLRTFGAGTIELDDGETVLLVPAMPLATDPPRLWLCAAPLPGTDPLTFTMTALRTVSFALSAGLANSSLAHERLNQHTGPLLEEILRRTDSMSLSDLEQAAALGWHLVGWHVAAQVRAQGGHDSQPSPSSLSRALAHALVFHGITARPTALGAAVVLWITSESEPTSEEVDSFVDGVRAAVRMVESYYPGLRLNAGVGLPRDGAPGLGRSIEDALYALAFAESERGRSVVQRSDSMTTNRLIRAWLPQGIAREVVAAVLDPLRDADPTGELLRTLRCYLDEESNMSKAAARLHIHRNTALQRLARIRALVDVDFDDPDDRLAIRIALKLLSD